MVSYYPLTFGDTVRKKTTKVQKQIGRVLCACASFILPPVQNENRELSLCGSHFLQGMFVVMPLGFAIRSEVPTPLPKLTLETVQLARRTTRPIKCHALRG